MAEEEKKADAPAEGGDDAVQKKGEKPAEGGGGAGNQKITNIFLALNAVLLLVAAVMFFMTRTRDAKEASLADVKNSEGEHGAPAGGEHGAPAAGGHGEPAKAPNEADRFVKETFTVNLKDSKGAHYAKVDVEIEVDDDFVKGEVQRLSPRIRDFIVVTLSSRTYEQVESVDGRDFLREEIRNKINGYLSRGAIKNVYFTQFIIQ